MKRILPTLATLALLLGLPGTAGAFFGLGVQSDWQPARAHEPLPAVHFVVPAKDLPRICRTHPAAATYGCAFRDVPSKVCIIYTAANPPRWLMDHELKHCDGWDHGPTPRHLAAIESEPGAN